MELDLENQFADRAYPILASLVTPRPIALVTTISPDGKVNAAPFSFFNVLGAAPPILAFAPGDREDGIPKDAVLNIRLTHEFVVNLVDEAIPLRQSEAEELLAGAARRQTEVDHAAAGLERVGHRLPEG
jgi:flavin reductase (DIM6/NTAB) family NADH-FMN oxidoreductase RutF